MAVVPFPNLPPQGPGGGMEWELRTISARQMSPLDAVATTLERAGSHWAVRMPYENLATDRRARMQTLAASLRGFANRTYVPVYGWTRRGSFPATELLTNNDFSSGTTGWTTAGGVGAVTQTVADGVLRATWNGGALASQDFLRATPAATVTQYAPYAMRYLMTQGKYAGVVRAAFRNGSSVQIATGPSAVPGGLITFAYVPQDTSIISVVNGTPPAGTLAGDHILFHYASLARCAHVDNGPNVFDQSIAIDHANWTKNNVTVSAQYYTAPDGAATAERVIENTATTSHSIDRSFTKSAVAQDWCVSVAMRIGDVGGQRRFVCLRIDDGTSTNFVNAFFDLLNGTISTAASATGTYANPRAFVVPLGNNWYLCSVVGMTSTGTTVRVRTLMSDNGTNVSYTGDGASNIGLWRMTMAQSSVPVRLTETTTAAVASGTLQTGSALHLKGLPASTNGLLLQGDPVEIITNTSSQLVRVRSSLNSDAAGLGYLEFEPPLRVSPSDNAAVIVQNPMCRMMSDRAVNGWRDRMGGFADTEMALVEDTYPS